MSAFSDLQSEGRQISSWAVMRLTARCYDGEAIQGAGEPWMRGVSPSGGGQQGHRSLPGRSAWREGKGLGVKAGVGPPWGEEEKAEKANQAASCR